MTHLEINRRNTPRKRGETKTLKSKRGDNLPQTHTENSKREKRHILTLAGYKEGHPLASETSTMFIKLKRLTRMVVTALGVGMVMYSSINLPLESFWRRTNTQRNARATLHAESQKYVNEKDWYKSVASEREDANLPVNQTSEWDFLVDLPVREEEDDDSDENAELDTAFKFSSLLLNPPSSPPAEWENRLPLSAFPPIRVSDCKNKPTRHDNSLVYPCKPKRRATANETALPTILEPSNGALLRRISQRRYDDPQVRIAAFGMLDR